MWLSNASCRIGHSIQRKQRALVWQCATSAANARKAAANTGRASPQQAPSGVQTVLSEPMPEPEPEPKAAAGAQQAAPDIPALDPEAEEQIGLHAEGEHFLDGRVPEPNGLTFEVRMID